MSPIAISDIVSFGQFMSGQFLGKSTAFKAIGLAKLPVCHPARQCRGPAMVPRHTAIENIVFGGGRQRRNVLSAISLQRQAELTAIPPR